MSADPIAILTAVFDRGPEAEDAPPITHLDTRQAYAAAAVVLVLMLHADGRVRKEELVALRRVLGRVLGLDPTDVLRFMQIGEKGFDVQVSLIRILEILDTQCSVELKKKVVHGLWRIAFADAELEAHEEYLVRKISKQLHLTMADLVETKIKAREEALRD
jgi:uncharacterized tellurite resistance protein B-like protein